RPGSGWSPAISSPFFTSLKRPLVARLIPLADDPTRLERTLCSCGEATPTGIMTAATTATAAAARHRHANDAVSTTPAASAAKLDCQKEQTRPTTTVTMRPP